MIEAPKYEPINPAELEDIEAEFGRPLTEDLALWIIRNRINREAVARMLGGPVSNQTSVNREVQRVRERRRLKLLQPISARRKECACPQCGQKNRVPAKYLASTGRCGACKAALPPIAEPLAVDDQLFNEITQNVPVPMLVDFWAAWCGPCRAAAPEVARTAAEMAGRAVVLKVDTEEYPQLAARFSIRGIPNFVIFYEGQLVRQEAGLVDHRQMIQWLAMAAAAKGMR